jgi:hypothetical protein
MTMNTHSFALALPPERLSVTDLILDDTGIVLIVIMSIAQDTEIAQEKIVIKTARALAFANGFP